MIIYSYWQVKVPLHFRKSSSLKIFQIFIAFNSKTPFLQIHSNMKAILSPKKHINWLYVATKYMRQCSKTASRKWLN